MSKIDWMPSVPSCAAVAVVIVFQIRNPLQVQLLVFGKVCTVAPEEVSRARDRLDPLQDNA